MSFLTEVDVYPLPDFVVRNPSLFSRAATSYSGPRFLDHPASYT
jgi:hypothetical protein